MKISKKLQKIADASVAYKIQAIENYLNDLSEFDIKALKLTIMEQKGLPEKEAELESINLCQESLWGEFRDALRADTHYWAQVCMKHVMKNKTPKFHIDAYDALDDDSKRFKCFVRYRGSAKTAQKTNKILHDVCECIDPVIVLISSAIGLASNEIIDIRAEIESNDIIKYIYGDLKGSDIWNTKALEFANGVYLAAKGTTSQIRGTKWKGQRPTAVYLDDFEDEKNADTDDKRKALRRWFSAQIMPIGDVDFKVVLFGTIVHPDAFLANADPKWNEETKQYDNPNSMFKGDKGFFSRVDIADKDGNPTWGERYSKEWIESERSLHAAENTLAFFYQEYYNIPAQESNPIIDVRMINDINGVFKEEYGVKYIEVFRPDDLIRMNPIKKIPVNVFIGVDPTRGAKASSDDFSMAAIGVTPGKSYIILDIFARVTPIKDQAQTVVDFMLKWNPEHTTIETYGYQLALMTYVEQLFESMGNSNYTIFEFNENKSKKAKYKESLCNPIANGLVGRIRGCNNYDKFENQAAKYSGGETEKDDTLDAVTLAIHEKEADGKMIWGPSYDDIDVAIEKARIRYLKKRSKKKKKKNFMGW